MRKTATLLAICAAFGACLYFLTPGKPAPQPIQDDSNQELVEPLPPVQDAGALLNLALTSAEPRIMETYNNALLKLSSRIRPSIVRITAKTTPPNSTTIETTGVMTAPDALILASGLGDAPFHSIQITTHEGINIPASISDFDPGSALAVLKPSSGTLPMATLSEKSEPAEILLAYRWNSPLQSIGVSQSLLSATGFATLSPTPVNIECFSFSPHPSPMAQAEPAILFNLRGQLAGIQPTLPTPKDSPLAISHQHIQWILNSIKKYGFIQRAAIGATFQPITEKERLRLELGDQLGIQVATVLPDMPAVQAGLKKGDIVLRVNGFPVRTLASLHRMIDYAEIGMTLSLQIRREIPSPTPDGPTFEQFSLNITTAAHPSRFSPTLTLPPPAATNESTSDHAATAHKNNGN